MGSRSTLAMLGLLVAACAAPAPAPSGDRNGRPSISPAESFARASPAASRAVAVPPSAPSPAWPAPAQALVRPEPTTGPAATGTIVFSRDGDVFRLDVAGGRVTRLTDDPADEFDPDLSPDGRLVAYRRASGAGDQADIWAMRRDGTGKRDLTADPALHNWAPAWSPDGTSLCFNSTRDAGTNRVWTMTADGTDPRLVTDGWGEYCDWSPDGASLVYAAAPGGGTYDLWIARLDGSDPVHLTSLRDTEFFPAWSPDGAWIAFEHLGSGVWLVHPDGSEPRYLGEGGGIVWSPDGRLGLDRPGGFGLYDPRADTFQLLGLESGEFPSWGR